MRIHLRAELVMQPLVNQICVVKTWSRAPNEPLFNRSYGSAESRFFRRTQKDAQFKLGQRHGRILFVLLFASILRIMAQWTEEESLQLIRRILLSKFSKSAGEILVKFLYYPQMYCDFMSNINSDTDRFLCISVRHQRRAFLFLLFKLVIIKAEQLTTTTAKFSSREDVEAKA